MSRGRDGRIRALIGLLLAPCEEVVHDPGRQTQSHRSPLRTRASRKATFSGLLRECLSEAKDELIAPVPEREREGSLVENCHTCRAKFVRHRLVDERMTDDHSPLRR
jgi:hypothetical protein